MLQRLSSEGNATHVRSGRSSPPLRPRYLWFGLQATTREQHDYSLRSMTAGLSAKHATRGLFNPILTKLAANVLVVSDIRSSTGTNGPKQTWAQMVKSV